MKPRCVGAIALGPNRNAQGGVNFFSLYSGQLFDRRRNNYNLLPMPAEAITRVEKMAWRSPVGLVFGDRTNVIDNDDDEDDNESYVPGEESDDDGSSSDKDDDALCTTW